MAYSIRFDEDSIVHIDGEAPSLLGMFLETISLDDCVSVLSDLVDVREGESKSYSCRYDAVSLTILPNGASFKIAAKLTHNADIHLTLDELEEGLRRWQAAFAGEEQS